MCLEQCLPQSSAFLVSSHDISPRSGRENTNWHFRGQLAISRTVSFVQNRTRLEVGDVVFILSLFWVTCWSLGFWELQKFWVFWPMFCLGFAGQKGRWRHHIQASTIKHRSGSKQVKCSLTDAPWNWSESASMMDTVLKCFFTFVWGDAYSSAAAPRNLVGHAEDPHQGLSSCCQMVRHPSSVVPAFSELGRGEAKMMVFPCPYEKKIHKTWNVIL